MRVVRGAATILLVASLLALPIPEAQAQTLVVNSTADPGDADCSDGTCTLRDAIDIANIDATQDTIDFDILGIGPHSIQLVSGLPTIAHPVVIDATSEPDWAAGAPVVELDGSGLVGTERGLSVDATVTIKGLIVNGFPSHGIQLVFGSDGSTIEGNFVGTDAAGTTVAPNGGAGILVFGPNNVIGGNTPAQRNVIGGNGAEAGIAIINASASGNTVLGNHIGVGSDGSTDVGNTGRGVWVHNASGSTVGAPGARNVISGNSLQGIFVNGDSFDGTVIQNNRIGTDATGTSALPNGEEGIELASPITLQTVTIGGTGEFDGNLISGNTNDGLLVSTDLDITIQGNKIGTAAAGNAAVPNGGHGIVSNSPALIGSVDGLAAGGNVISGNAGHGIDIAQSAAGAVVQGNVIGTDPSTFIAVGNGGDGVFHHGPVNTPSTTLIGGPSGGFNVLSGNGGAGVRIDGLAGVTVQGNSIGTNAPGALPVPNNIGIVLNTDQATIGGTGANDGNVISGNTNEGVVIGQTADGNLIQGNRIGVASDGQTPLSNGSHGVSITAADANLIGGTDPPAANVIASNGGDGVRIVDMSVSAADNAILGNSITGNTGLGIDLAGDGVTANDLLDNDLGPNGRQNFPEIDIALSGGGTTWVAGTLHSEFETTYRIEVFADPDGQGRDLLGSTVVTTDGSHNAAFSITAPVATDPGLEVAATATELVDGTPGSTSEFSDPAFIVPPCDDTAPPGGGTVVGTPNDDILCGGDGDDIFDGGGGNDFIFGGGGSDTLRHAGAAGPITANLGAGRVIDDGEGGDDRIFDVENVIGTPFDDVIVGDGGPNVLRGSGGHDVLVGGAGGDTLLGGDGQDDLRGGDGHDALRGQGGPDLVRGGSGNDTMLGGTHGDTLLGGAGHDILLGQAGGDVVWGGVGQDDLRGGAGHDAMRGQGGPDLLRGHDGDDTLLGGTHGDTLLGGDGNDDLRGQGGSDTLNGGAHVDKCIGGAGSDTLANCEL